MANDCPLGVGPTSCFCCSCCESVFLVYVCLFLSEVWWEVTTLIENSQRHFQATLFGCFDYVPFIALTIVCTINVSIDCKKNKVSNPFTRKNILHCKSRQEDTWFVFCFKIKLCAKMMISLFLRLMKT